jgi:similar to spore coat protein
MKMNSVIENLTGMDAMSDQVIATDLLISAKTGVIRSAVALTEMATPELKETLRKQLDQTITFHQQVTEYMMSRGLYHPYQMKEQLAVDLQNAQTALNMS